MNKLLSWSIIATILSAQSIGVISFTSSSISRCKSFPFVPPQYRNSIHQRLLSTENTEEIASNDNDTVESTAGESSDSIDAEAAKTTTVAATTEVGDVGNNISDEIEKKKLFLFGLGAITGRGEYASAQQHQSAKKVVKELEQLSESNDQISIDQLTGTWDLVYSTTELFRSSPFFMAGRAVCTTEVQAQQYNWFCSMHRKALAISNIVGVRQVISDSKLVSEFEVKVGSIPFLSDFTPFRYSGGLPVTIDGTIVSTADISSISDSGDIELYMDTVEIKGSNIPGLRQLYDNQLLKLQSRTLANFLETNVPSYKTPKPVFRTTYLDKTIRIGRDEDSNIFVYVKTSDSTEPTSYKDIDSDLGIGKLLEGFNDAITRVYI